MRGSVRHRRTWEYRLNVGLQPAQRCTACDRLYWVERKKLEACPKCGGALHDVTERRQQCVSGFRTKRDAEEALNAVLTTMQVGTYVSPQKLTVAAFLTNEWLPAIKGTIRPSTLLAYTGHVEGHIIPALGTVPLQKLTGGRINVFYNSLQVAKADGGPGLSSATVRRVHATLHRALRDAARWGHVQHNVNAADQADAPKATRKGAPTLHVWTVPEVQTFLKATREERQRPLWQFFLATGMRRGEVCGLMWNDVDLDNGMVTVQRALVSVGYHIQVSETKTGRTRAVDIDPGTVTALKAWHKVQTAERVKWGKLWTNTGLVFTREDGAGWHPDRVSKMFDEAILRVQKGQKRAAEKRGDKEPTILPRIRLHDLRHTHATVALISGEQLKVISSRLGHAQTSMTADTYMHMVPGLQKDAAARIGALMFGG